MKTISLCSIVLLLAFAGCTQNKPEVKPPAEYPNRTDDPGILRDADAVGRFQIVAVEVESVVSSGGIIKEKKLARLDTVTGAVWLYECFHTDEYYEDGWVPVSEDGKFHKRKEEIDALTKSATAKSKTNEPTWRTTKPQ